MYRLVLCFLLIVIISCDRYSNISNFSTTKDISNEVSICTDTSFVYITNGNINKVKLYYKDNNGNAYKYFYDLNNYLKSESKDVIFMTNAGMYLQNYSPMGLLIQEGKVIKRINKYHSSLGNFYKQPNGVFYIDESNKAHICTTQDFKYSKNIQLATQSGPMLLVNGSITEACKNSSSIPRNGVGILPNGEIIFALIYNITLYKFAEYFKNKGCRVALNLDGGISDVYYPSKGKLEGGTDFGPILVVTK